MSQELAHRGARVILACRSRERGQQALAEIQATSKSNRLLLGDQCMKVKSESEVAQSCLTLSDPMDCSLPGSSVHGIFQARVLEWDAIAFSAEDVRRH